MKKLMATVIVLTCVAAGLTAAEKTLAVSFGPVQELLTARCAACHDWAAAAEGILGKVKPGAPDESQIWQKVSADSMPPDGPLAADEKALLKDWIAAGAPTDGSAAADATTGATEDAGDAAGAAPSSFLGFKSKTAFHMATGYTSSALFLGAGIVGAVQFGTLMYEAHQFRVDDEFDNDTCPDIITDLRSNPTHAALRWTHVGLMAAGEALYLADAITGLSMLTKDRPGLTPQDIHRYAFFTHGALMISEIVLGILESSLLSAGDHWTMIGMGIAHTAIGVAIPVVMLSAGIYINTVFR